MAGVARPTPERQRDRVLSHDEIRAVWHALDQEPVRIAAIFRILLLTAQRRSEVTSMLWQELDLKSHW